MIDFDTELQKFQPCLEIEDTEDTIYSNNDVPDITELINKIIGAKE